MPENTHILISDLQPGANIDQIFLVRDKDLRTASNGGLYVMCTLGDRSGTVPARMWRANEAIFNAIPTDGFIRVRGRTENYRGNLQFIIEALQPVAKNQVDLSMFLPVTQNDMEEMWSELLEVMRTIKNQWLKLLIKKFIADHELVARFKRSPAAVEMHQAYIGGLLEHTLHIMRLIDAITKLYPKLNRDLMLAGAFLHDLGKIDELTGEVAFSYTARGQLVGHITMAAIWVQQKADEVSLDADEPFPPRIIDLVQHIILSHHGVYEYGSPKLPMIPEAMALHYLDNLDAKMNMFERLITTDPDDKSDFTGYSRALEVRVYKHSKELDQHEATLFEQD